MDADAARRREDTRAESEQLLIEGEQLRGQSKAAQRRSRECIEHTKQLHERIEWEGPPRDQPVLAEDDDELPAIHDRRCPGIAYRRRHRARSIHMSDHPTPEHPERATDQLAQTGTTGSSRRRVLSDVDAETWMRSLREQQADHKQADHQRRHKARLIARPAMDDTNEKEH